MLKSFVRIINDLKYPGIWFLDMSLTNIAYIVNKLNSTADKYCHTHSIQGKLRLDVSAHLSYSNEFTLK